jgi:DNA-binding CsgD family transcriptional regulator
MAAGRAWRGADQLLERDAELAQIDELIAASVGGEGRFLVIEGRSGIGKTALLAELKTRAQQSGMSICAARGSDLESDFAFGVVRQLFEPWVWSHGEGEGSRLFEGAAALAAPVLGLSGEQGAGALFPALHGLYWLAADLAARAPLLLAVDDAHWADQPSLSWLAYLLNRLEGLAILVAVGTRPPPAAGEGELIARLIADPQVDLLRLRPLGEGSIAALLAGALGAEPDALFTAACHRATAGNPLALRGVVQDLAAQGVRPTAPAAELLEHQVPDALSRRLQVRLGRPGHPATRLARGLAVMGDGSELLQVAALMELDEQEATAVADELSAADILEAKLPLRFVHPLIRAVVYESIPVAARSRLHRQAANLLSAQAADAETVAAHLLRCPPDGAPGTVERLRAAAQAAIRRGAPEAALVYLRRGLVDSMDPTVRVSVLTELGRAELVAGDHRAAKDHLSEAVNDCSEAVARGKARNNLANAVMRAQGDPKLSVELMLQALGELGDSDPETSERIEVTICVLASSTSNAPAVADPLVRLSAIAAGQGPAARRADVALAYLLALRAERREDVLSHLDRGLEGGTFITQETAHTGAPTWAAGALLYTDELVRAGTFAREMQADAAARGSTHGLVQGLAYAAGAAYYSGMVADAEAAVEAALDLAQPNDYWWTTCASVQARFLLELGRTEAALAVIGTIRLQPGTEGDVPSAWVLAHRGYVLCAADRKDEGIAALRECGEIASAAGLLNPLWLPWRSDLAMNLPAEAREEARSLVAAELELGRRMGVPRAVGVVLRAAAALERDADAVDLLRDSVALLTASPGVLELARAQLDLGAALRRLGHRVEAREPLLQALEIATRCGAVPLAERAREESLLAGARPRRPRLRGIDALTPAELRVARKAAEGLSNREIAQALFITTKTVTDHLGSSYGKLQITSRTELAAALAPGGG